MSLKLQVVLLTLLHYGTFVFIFICYLASPLAIFHAYRGETILI